MEKPNFDKVIDRHGTNCTKYDAVTEFIGDRSDILPMWIADMDFETPHFIIDAIKERLEHPILGYTVPGPEYYAALQGWFEKKYGFRPEKEHLCYTPGIVSGIYKVIECLTQEGDGVVLCPPVYHPFAQVVRGSRRRIVEAPLLLREDTFDIDFEALDRALGDAKLLIWCHPHNPGGRVWTTEELREVVQLAHKHGVRVISDEIHADLTFGSYTHHPLPSVSEEAKECSLSFMAPSKAFNMPGIIASQLYIPGEQLRKEVFGYLELNCLNAASAPTYPAVVAAYTKGEEWLSHAIEYIEANVAYVKEYLQENIPRIKMLTPQASFLIFLDCRELGMATGQELETFFVEKAGLLLNNGTMFGTGGEGFMRLNVGVPRSILEQAMKKLQKAVESL